MPRGEETSVIATWDLKIKLPPEKAKAVVASLQQQVKATPYFPSASDDRQRRGPRHAAIRPVYALVASWSLIIIYLWMRFQGVAFGLAAVIALIHDVLVMLGGHRLQLLHRARFPGCR